MGGNAVKGFGEVIRLNTKQYDELALEIVAVLSTEDIQLYPIPSYNNKDSHGDMDLIVQSLFWHKTSRESVKQKIGAIGFVQNGTVTSYAVPYGDSTIFQVDIITVPEDKLDFAYSYFSYNDLGNLIGRIAHLAGFKLGHLGLQYILRDPENSNHVVNEITVTSNWADAISFFGYDVSTYLEGFDKLEDIFEYTMTSPIANRDIFLLENRNNTSRTRDRKRNTYMKFLTWLNSNPEFNVPPLDKEQIRKEYLEKAFVYFSNFKEEYDSAMEYFYMQKKVKSIINGDSIQELTGYSGEELGAFISTFKEAYPIRELANMSKPDIFIRLADFHEEWKQTSGY